MEGLQIQVGSHETGELPVVVVLVNMKELLIITWHNGKTVLGNGLIEPLVEVCQLIGIDDVGHIDHRPCRNNIVLLLQRVFMRLQLIDEIQLSLRILDRLRLTFLLFPEAVFHLFRIPCGSTEESTQVTVHETVAVACRHCIAQHTCLSNREAVDIDVERQFVFQFLHIDFSLTGDDDRAWLLLLCPYTSRKDSHHHDE